MTRMSHLGSAAPGAIQPLVLYLRLCRCLSPQDTGYLVEYLAVDSRTIRPAYLDSRDR